MSKFAISILGAAALLLAGCKPTEANYRQAYEAAVAARNSSEEGDSLYQGVRRNMDFGEMAVGSDTAAVISQFVKITPDGGGINEYIKRYCVVAGAFKQQFTAKALRQRLAEGGYPGAFVVQNREPYYYVVAGSFADAAEAMELLKQLRADKAWQLRAPLPYILRPSQIR